MRAFALAAVFSVAFVLAAYFAVLYVAALLTSHLSVTL